MVSAIKFYCVVCGEEQPFERLLTQRVEDGNMEPLEPTYGIVCPPCVVKEFPQSHRSQEFELSREELRERREEKGIVPAGGRRKRVTWMEG